MKGLTRQVTFRLDVSTHNRLKVIAERSERSLPAVLRIVLIKDWLKAERLTTRTQELLREQRSSERLKRTRK